MNYWSKKDELSKIARDHTQFMIDKYKDEINECESFICNDNRESFHNSLETQNLIKGTSTDALFSDYCKNWEHKRICVLNFASYKNPGGGFLSGSSAQEESLCHTSYLYNILEKMRPYYDYNKQHLNKGMYLNRAIYSKNVRFFSGNKTMRSDVLTCAAPNYSVAIKFGSFTKEQNYEALKSRINFIKGIASIYCVDTMILGAWGCGVFKQDPKTVIELFLDHGFPVKNVIYAVPDDKTYKIFNKFI